MCWDFSAFCVAMSTGKEAQTLDVQVPGGRRIGGRRQGGDGRGSELAEGFCEKRPLQKRPLQERPLENPASATRCGWRGLLPCMVNSPSLRVLPRPAQREFAWWVHPAALGSRTSRAADRSSIRRTFSFSSRAGDISRHTSKEHDRERRTNNSSTCYIVRLSGMPRAHSHR